MNFCIPTIQQTTSGLHLRLVSWERKEEKAKPISLYRKSPTFRARTQPCRVLIRDQKHSNPINRLFTLDDIRVPISQSTERPCLPHVKNAGVNPVTDEFLNSHTLRLSVSLFLCRSSLDRAVGLAPATTFGLIALRPRMPTRSREGFTTR